MSSDATPKAPHMGGFLSAYFERHRTRRSGLARVIGIAPDQIYKYQRRASFTTDTLWRLSHALKHNFFADLAALLPAEYSIDAPGDEATAARIAELEKEVERLTVERDVWRAAAGR